MYTYICKKQLPYQRGGDLCVCQQSTDIIYFTRRSISDVDTIWIFIESYMKNYYEVEVGAEMSPCLIPVSIYILSVRAPLKPTLAFIPS